MNKPLLSLFQQAAPPFGGFKKVAKGKIASQMSQKNGALLSKLSQESFSPQYIQTVVIKSILHAIFFGLLAGFILNFMPCVLPVVSIKVLSLVKHAGESQKRHVILGLLFSAGILTSFTLLAILAAFFGKNWGSLFQNRTFLISMTAIVFALALFDVPGIKSSQLKVLIL